MSDTISRDTDTTRHDGLEAVTPTEAARRLGITPDSVRARLRRGTLKGEQVDREWRVFLPAEPETTANRIEEPRHDADTTHRAMSHDTDTTVYVALSAAKDDTITRLDTEVEYRRTQLDHSRRELSAERERFDIIHREALQRIEALTDGGADEIAFGSSHSDASPETISASEDDAMGQALHQSSRFVDLWGWMTGRS